MFKKLIQMFKPDRWTQRTLYAHRFFAAGTVWLFEEPPHSVEDLQKDHVYIADSRMFPELQYLQPGETREIKIMVKES